MPNNRYWVYVHDADGDIVEDFGEFSDLREVHAALSEWFMHDGMQLFEGHALRVDDDETLYGESIWWMGPAALLDRDR